MSSSDIPVQRPDGGTKFLDRMRRKNAGNPAPTPMSVAPVKAARTGQRHLPDSTPPAGPEKRERFIPVTKFALIDRLTQAAAWPGGEAADARRFFRYLDYWRQQQYSAQLLELEQSYEPFSPDSDLLITRQFSAAEKKILQRRVVEGVESLLVRANYERVDPAALEIIMTPDSHYGLDLHVDMKAFEEILIYTRGSSSKDDEKRDLKKFGRKTKFTIPIYKRLFILFKLKTFHARVDEVMQTEGLDKSEAEKRVRKLRSVLPPGIKDDFIYLKLFKNIPRTDIEMVFPNTEVKFRSFDKLRLGVSAGGGLGMGAVGAAGKMALLFTNPIAAAGAVVGFGGVAARQAQAFMNQKQKYMAVMAQNLYLHSMDDNRGVILKVAARGAEEDIKEEVLLYSVLAKEKALRADLPAIDAAIEQYLKRSFGVNADFEIDDALERLLRDGIVKEAADGSFATLSPKDAAKHIDVQWDQLLDNLPDPLSAEGFEFGDRSGGRIA